MKLSYFVLPMFLSYNFFFQPIGSQVHINGFCETVPIIGKKFYYANLFKLTGAKLLKLAIFSDIVIMLSAGIPKCERL